MLMVIRDKLLRRTIEPEKPKKKISSEAVQMRRELVQYYRKFLPGAWVCGLMMIALTVIYTQSYIAGAGMTAAVFGIIRLLIISMNKLTLD